MSKAMRVPPDELRAIASDLVRMSAETDHVRGEVRHQWSRLDHGWQSYARGDVDGQYRETMREIERMALMLQQMAEALVKTADLIEEADREAAGFFDLRPAEGVQPATRIVASTPPPLGYTTPLPGSSTIPSAPPANGQPLPVDNNSLPIGTSGNWAMDLNTGELVWTGPAPSTPQEAWQIQVVSDLWRAGPTCQHAARYLAEHDIQIGFAQQDASAARWWVDAQTREWVIQLDPDYYAMSEPSGTPAYAKALAAIVHEAMHLEQGPLLALSILGEVQAWKTDEAARSELGLPSNSLSHNGEHWAEVIDLPDSPTDEELERARIAMMAYSPGYRAWALPLRPNTGALLEHFSTLYEHHAELWQLITGQ